jgi:VRR-NUC domain
VSEAAIQHAILLRFGNDPRCRLWRTNSGRLPDPKTGRWVQFNFEGCPDLCGFLKGGRAFYIEVKRPGGKLSPAQVAFRNIAIHWGALHVVALSPEDVEAALAAA